MNIKLVNSKVNAILKSLSDISLPINIEEIAKMRGLKVIPYPLGDDVSGLLAIQDGIGTIGYNKNEPKVRRRFTIAHELGHYELHKEKSDLFVDKQFIYRSQNSGNTAVNQAMEQEANYFASAILMPADQVRKAIEKANMDLGSEEAIKELAKIFEVSTTAMSIRISSLGMF
ncbi:ImmA/IrrE family metallo-endopeptidase [Pollutibacter soli]|uniref:ImmA/IrrE family metallo-endopeptidase n=1 Tax=Pollutibacter soli TaxID=3034157 RepID=UPI003013DA21